MQARYQIAVMEAVLEAAVQHGAQTVRGQIQAVMPDMVVLAGAPRARGFRLDGYGMFFDVEVPAMSQTIAWSFKTLEQNNLSMAATLAQLRSSLQALPDRRLRDDLDQQLRVLAQRLGVTQVPTVQQGDAAMPPPGVVTASGLSQGKPETPKAIDDPLEAYTTEVKTALIDAMLDYSGPLNVAHEEWLTVAARDNEDRRISPSNVYEVATIVLRIKGSDLAEFRAGRLSREEARRKVEVREF
jgi:hypothetical protein